MPDGEHPVIDGVQIRLLKAEKAPAVFFVDGAGMCASSSRDADDLWPRIRDGVRHAMSVYRAQIDSGETLALLIDRTYSLRIRRLYGKLNQYAAIVQPARTHDTLRASTSRFRLTQREHEVAALLVTGKNTGEIADELSIARSTVTLHVKRILAKTGARSRSALVGLIVRRDHDEWSDE